MLKREIIGPDVLLLSFEISRLDAANAIEFRDVSSRMVGDEFNNVLLDMADLQFVDSSGLGALLGLRKRLSDRGKIVLCNLQPAVAKIFGLTGLDRIFKVYTSREAAAVEGFKLSKPFKSSSAGLDDKVIEMVARAISITFNRKIPSLPDQAETDNEGWREWLDEATAAVNVIKSEMANSQK